MNRYECDVLEDKKIKQLAIQKLLNIKNILGAFAVIILVFVTIVAFNNNVLKPSESLLREQEVKNFLLLLIPFTIAEIIFIIVFYIKIKRYLKVITGRYKCISTVVIDKCEEHSEERYNDGTVDSYSSYYLELKGTKKLVIVSKEEYSILNKNDKCYAVMFDNNSINEIVSKNIILVIKANNYNGKNQVIEAVNYEEEDK